MHTLHFCFLLYKKPRFLQDDFYAASQRGTPVPLWLFRGDILQLEIGCSPGAGLGTVPSSARLEPCNYMSVVTGYVRKFSDKLQIEMLRAYRPDQFKTPGTNVNIGTRGDIFVLSEDQRHELQRINREFLESTPVRPCFELGLQRILCPIH